MRQVIVFLALPIFIIAAIVVARDIVSVYSVSDVSSVNIPDIKGFKKPTFSKCSVNEFAFLKREKQSYAFKSKMKLNLDLESIFISKNIKYCYINGKLFREGDSRFGFRVLRIYRDGVIVKTNSGKLKVSLNVQATEKN